MQSSSNHERHLRHVLAALAGGTLAAFGAACAIEGEPDAPRSEMRSVALSGGTEACVRLMAGQHTHAGWVCVEVYHGLDTSPSCGAGSSGVVKVRYETQGGWYLTEEHLAVGDEHDDIPRNNGGNPMPGQFEYHYEDAGHTSHTFYVPLCHFGLDDSDDDCDAVLAHFAAHAVVEKDHDGWCEQETAWGEGAQLGAHGWSMYFTHELHCEHEPC